MIETKEPGRRQHERRYRLCRDGVRHRGKKGARNTGSALAASGWRQDAAPREDRNFDLALQVVDLIDFQFRAKKAPPATRGADTLATFPLSAHRQG